MRILFLYGVPIEATLRKIISGELPSDRMFGFVELKNLGYDIDFSDSQPKGLLKNFIKFINGRLGTNIKELSTITHFMKFDVIIINDRYSTLLTIACRLFGKKLVYIDALFRIPQNRINRLLYKINLLLSSGTIVYSNEQLKIWSDFFHISPLKFKAIPYAIDVPFYTAQSGIKEEPFILSVGRDIARDYRTLVDAVDGLGINLKIVSLPYLFEGFYKKYSWFELLQHIPYHELFQLYRDALFVVIPLKKWGVVYPSGIRALLEAMALGKCVVASDSPVLKEYAGPNEGVMYVEPENVQELRCKIVELLENRKRLPLMEGNIKDVVQRKYNMDVFARKFGDYLSELHKGAKIV